MSKAITSRATMLQMGSGGSAGQAKTITSTAAGTPYTLVTATAHGFKTGDNVTIAGVTGTGATAVNGIRKVLALTADIFAVAVATTGAGSGGTATPTAESFTTIAEVGDIAGPTLVRDSVDVTTHDSDEGYEELLPTVMKSGEVSFPIHWVPDDATHDETTGLLSELQDGGWHNFKLIAPDDEASTLAFTAFVSQFDLKAPVNGVLSADVKLKVSGPVVFSSTE